jgi:hypothetical protein
LRFTVAKKLTPYRMQQRARMPYVTGEVIGTNRASDRLAAERPNVALAPH